MGGISGRKTGRLKERAASGKSETRREGVSKGEGGVKLDIEASSLGGWKSVRLSDIRIGASISEGRPAMAVDEVGSVCGEGAGQRWDGEVKVTKSSSKFICGSA